MSNELNSIIQRAEERNPGNDDIQMLIRLVQQYHNACVKNEQAVGNAKRIIGDHVLLVYDMEQSIASQAQTIQLLRTQLNEAIDTVGELQDDLKQSNKEIEDLENKISDLDEELKQQGMGDGY